MKLEIPYNLAQYSEIFLPMSCSPLWISCTPSPYPKTPSHSQEYFPQDDLQPSLSGGCCLTDPVKGLLDRTALYTRTLTSCGGSQQETSIQTQSDRICRGWNNLMLVVTLSTGALHLIILIKMIVGIVITFRSSIISHPIFRNCKICVAFRK